MTVSKARDGFAGIGGDAFALMYKAADKSVSAIMGSGRSPRKMTLNVSF